MAQEIVAGNKSIQDFSEEGTTYSQVLKMLEIGIDQLTVGKVI